MRTNKKILYFASLLIIVGAICIVAVFSKPAQIDKSVASPEINPSPDKEIEKAAVQDLVASKLQPYFPEEKE